MTTDPIDLHPIGTLAESASGAADAVLRIVKLPEDSVTVGLLRIARDQTREIVRLIDESEGEGAAD